MPEFRRSRSEKDAAGIEDAWVTACLPGLDPKFVQQRAVEGEADQIFVKPGAALPFNALGRALDAADQFAFWAQAPWRPSVEALPWSPALPRLIGENPSRSHRNAGRRTAARSAAYRLERLG